VLEKLKDIAAVIILPALILYFLGFICITSSLARFGIVTFDIVNARFLIAGIFPLIALIFAYSCARYFFARMGPPRNLFTFNSWRSRIRVYVEVIGFIYVVSLVFAALVHLGTITPPSDQSSPRFSPFGTYDVVGRLLIKVPLSPGDDLNYIIFVTLYISGYVLLPLIIGAVVFLIPCKLLSAARRSHKSLSNLADPPSLLFQERLRSLPRPPPRRPPRPPPAPVQDAVTTDTQLSLVTKSVSVSVDIIVVATMIALFFWASQTLRLNTVSYQSLNNPHDLSEGLVFVWLYITVLWIEIFMFWSAGHEGISTRLSDWVSDPVGMAAVVQQLIIPVVTSVFVFGATVFPRIPFDIGGGEPRSVIVMTKPPAEKFEGKHVFMIGESTQFLFLVDSTQHRAVQLNKDSVIYVELKRATSTERSAN
jgi:hypothetical protein